MHVEYLYYFKDFIETLSISKSAQHFFMSPQGLSRALHQLEKDFGIELITNQGNTISLTPAGQELGCRIDAIIESIEGARGALAGYKLASLNEGRECLTVLSTPCCCNYLYPLLDIQKPGLFPFEVRLQETEISSMNPYLEGIERGMTVALVSFPRTEQFRSTINDIEESTNVCFLPLIDSPLIALVSAYSSLAKLDVITPESVTDCTVVRYNDSSLADALLDFVRVDTVSTVTNSPSILRSQIRNAHAVSFAPKLILETGRPGDGIVDVPTDGFFSTTFGLLVPTDYKDNDNEAIFTLCTAVRGILENLNSTSQKSSFTMIPKSH